MRTTPWLVAISLGLVCLHASAQKVPQRGLCAANEEPVFACTLEGRSHKMVALCASPASAEGSRSFRYRFGLPSKIEMEYPVSGDGNDVFTRTPLHLGAWVGYAFSFTNDGYKYILYSTEGIRDARVGESGLMVQREGESHASHDMLCRSSASTTFDNKLLDSAISKWKVDAAIEAKNLPATH